MNFLLDRHVDRGKNQPVSYANLVPAKLCVIIYWLRVWFSLPIWAKYTFPPVMVRAQARHDTITWRAGNVYIQRNVEACSGTSCILEPFKMVI